ncbi:hypothetical protein FE697_007240 [Mumia zhuanghuii]|uniref:DUF222 domain-containing protein n=2 Tax=Mumia TaxID=1546255 RepID=A0ABW1QK63_9ACTN|nr:MULTISPECIES: hypothetical protein [Mumia]KAA1423398.1 hypothetical protein FE697_007240 [Mumia zhuanghuii]
MPSPNTLLAEQVRAGLHEHGVKVPALTRAAKHLAEVQAWGRTGPADLPGIIDHQHQPAMLATAVRDALSRGEDPTLDPTVRRIVIAQAITPSVFFERVASIAVDRYAATITTNEDTIIAKLTPAFDQHVTALAAAAERLGPDVNLDDDAAVLELDVRDLALPARDARKALNQLVRLLQSIDQLTTGRPQPAALHLAALDADDWDVLGLTGSRPTDPPDTYAMVQHGVPWSLAGTTDTRARVDALAAQRRDRATNLTHAPETQRA